MEHHTTAYSLAATVALAPKYVSTSTRLCHNMSSRETNSMDRCSRCARNLAKRHMHHAEAVGSRHAFARCFLTRGGSPRLKHDSNRVVKRMARSCARLQALLVYLMAYCCHVQLPECYAVIARVIQLAIRSAMLYVGLLISLNFSKYGILHRSPAH